MFLSRAVFDAINAERIQAVERAKVLAEQMAAMRTQMEWFCHRVQQLEQERARLLWQYMGVKVETPQFVKPDPPQDDVLGGANVFQDIGDEAATQAGIGWHDDGTVKTN